MLHVPSGPGRRRASNLNGQPTASWGTNVQAGGSAHALSASFVELFAATDFDTHWVTVFVHSTAGAATRTDTLLNIYVGANGSEVLLIDSLAVGWASTMSLGDFKLIGFPLFIPAGTRITAKTRSVVGSKNCQVGIIIEGCGGMPAHWVGRGVETLGENTASSTGTSVTPGTGSEGTFTSIGTSTYRYGYVVPWSHGTLADTTQANNEIMFDIGSGGTALPGLSDFSFNSNTNEAISAWGARGRFCNIPAGTALQLRGQASGTAEAQDCLIYGVY
jgi:hypothetical protein